MEEQNITITQLNPDNFEFQNYIPSDEQLIATSDLDTVFSQDTDYIEYYVYDENQNKIYPSTTLPLLSYNEKNGDVLINPERDLSQLGFDQGIYNILYSFYRKRLSSDTFTKYFIREISSDRTEIRLDSNIISNENIISSTNEFILYREEQPYFVDFYLNFGDNQTIIANNIRLDETTTEDPTILIKLYNPLPEQFGVKDEVWVVEELSQPQLYQVNFPFNIVIEEDFEFISGPNYNIEVKTEKGKSGQQYTYNSLLGSNVTSSVNQLQNLLKTKEIEINIDYENFSEFVNFSSAKTRLENFYYKVGLIESYRNTIDNTLGSITSDTTSSYAYSSSVATYQSRIDEIIQNFDGYEYFLYFDSGSQYSWPKSNTEPPYALYSTGSTEVLNWIGSADPENSYFGGVALSASNYDQDNQDWLYWAIPEYLREDPENVRYELFVDMIGQHYDNIWVYIKDITNKFNADNRLDYGISKDLVADAIKDFGIKLYSNNFNTDDLYTAFLGITPSGSLFPYPTETGSLPTPSGFEYVDTLISASNDIIPLDDANKRLYKRIYHNLPYLLKTKGTIAGLRALITSYGIPDTILRINEFGGKDRNNYNDWDYGARKFNYALDLDGTEYLTSSFDLNDNFSTETPKTLQFRFKTKGIPTGSDFDRTYQTLWVGDANTSAIVLEYTGSGELSGSYSGSIADEYKNYGTIKFMPEAGVHPEFSASIYLPIFDGEWWSVMATLDTNGTSHTASLHVANRIGETVGFHETNSVSHVDVANYWNSLTTSSFPNPTNVEFDSTTYQPFSGSFQEIRYYTSVLSGSLFEDYVVNPYSIEGNSGLQTPNSLAFRADLGTLLDTENRTSVHPKITGSTSYITSSFEGDDSSFYLSGGTFIENKEFIYLDQFPAGIKNRITDKISIDNHVLPSGDTLSPLRSIQQTSYASSSYTPDINYLEVAFSPQDEINDDIISQYGYFNIGDYIGDPRHISSSDRSYPDLDTIRDAYFNKYINSYNVTDFVRLIKFFDNSLFRMIKDFTPARTSLSSGVVVKQHLLERNRQRPAQATWLDQTYSASIKPQSRNYDTGSGDVGQYEYNGGSSIYRFSGGTGGSFEKYNGLNTSPSASAYGLSNNYLLTQSYSESVDGSLGPKTLTIYNQEEFYDGEFSGSYIEVTDQDLNPGCNPYVTVPDTPVQYLPIFFNTERINTIGGTVNEEDWLNRLNSPLPGYSFILSIFNQDTQESKVKHIKLARQDLNGVDIADYLYESDRVEFIFPEKESGTEYYIDGVTVNAGNVTLTIDQTQGDINVTSSYNGGSENWNLSASGDFTSSGASDLQSQGVFVAPLAHQEQFFQYWNKGVIDLNTVNGSPKFFNSGSDPSLHSSDNLEDWYTNGTYNPKRTSNVPWLISASISYSASDTGIEGAIDVNGRIINGGVYSIQQDQSTTINANITSSKTGSFSLPTQTFPVPGVDISDENFSFDITTTIPGYSGSGETPSGNRQVITPGTASISWEFDEMGVLLDGSAILQGIYPISGSDNIPTNDNFQTSSGFTPSTNGTQFNFSTFVTESSSEFGYYYIDVDTLENDYSVSSYTVTINCAFKYQYPLEYTGSFVTAIIQQSTNGNTWTGGSVSSPLINPNQVGSQETGSANVSFTKSNFKGELYIRIAFSIPAGLNFEYAISEYKATWTSTVDWGNPGPTIPPGSIDILYYQGLETPSSTPSWNTITGASNLFSYKTKLMYTGSEGNTEITSSNIHTGSFIGSGTYNLAFPDSPITVDEHINTTQSMYYVEYEIYTDQVRNLGITPKSYSAYPQVYVTQSFEGGGNEFDLTGSLNIYRDNAENLPLTLGEVGNIIYSEEFIVPNSASEGTVTTAFVHQGEFDYDDVFRMSVEVDKTFRSGLHITSYDLKIIPSASILGRINGGASEYGVALYGQDNYGGSEDTLEVAFGNFSVPFLTDVVVPTYFTYNGENVLPFNLALDCQPLLNNYVNNRLSTFLMDVDYTNISGSIIPVNQQQILDNTAVKASVPDSNYTSLRSVNPRYKGSKSTSKYINRWAIGDTGTYGKLPTVELRNAYFGYFNGIEDPYPNKNDVVKLNLTYLIDQQGNALPPALEGISRDIFEKVFPLGSPGTLSISSGSKTLKKLNSSYPLDTIGSYPTPIMYSQNSGNGYTTFIPLTGSGRISRYDNDGGGISYFSFDIIGTASIDTSSPLTSFDYDIDPSEQLTFDSSITGSSPYNISNGVITYDGPDEIAGEDLTNSQKLTLQTSIPTSFIYDTNGTRDEVTLTLSLVSGSTNIPFNFKDIQLKVHKTTGVYDIGSVIGEGWLNFVSPGNTNVHAYTDTPRLNSNNQIQITIDYEMWYTLRKKGLYQMNGDVLFKNPELLSLEWILTADSGDYIFKGGDEVKWNLQGNMKTTSGNLPQAVFFPFDNPNSYDTPAKISSIGTLDYLFATDNTASAPYWVFGDQVGTTREGNVLYMSSSNMNEAYGTEYYQGNIPYTPGPSPYFPGDVEPVGTQFDSIEYPLEIKPGDEIRFANNENYSYTILNVLSPQENIINGVGRIKITLDKNVPGDVNKDFFLVRRNIPDANSVYVGTTFPYTNPPSASSSPGILFPEYPTIELEASASSIVTSLISKGVIS